jgi:hypothetical protein
MRAASGLGAVGGGCVCCVHIAMEDLSLVAYLSWAVQQLS